MGTGRIGDKRGTHKTTRTRRQPVWYFVCPVCGREEDYGAKRRPTANPLDIPEPTCEGGPSASFFDELHDTALMENKGLFFLSLDGDKKIRVPADKLRIEWAKARERALKGKVCTCGAYWWQHYVVAGVAYGCAKTGCERFTPKPFVPISINSDDGPAPWET